MSVREQDRVDANRSRVSLERARVLAALMAALRDDPQ